MKIKLINTPTYSSAIEQVLYNRGIAPQDFRHYLTTTDADINSPELLGKDLLKAAVAALLKTVRDDKRALVLVDADCDGYCSAALLINYLHDIVPSWVERRLEWFIHSGKQHGLSDVPLEDYEEFGLFLIPDAGSNDYSYHDQLKQMGIECVVLDHHEAECSSPSAIVLNNQLSDYPNKQLCGGGIVYQFCRYLDAMLNANYAEKYLDLVALANTADMMSLREFETKHLITKGFKDENLHNPFICGIAAKNAFTLGTKVTPMGAAFYIAPFVNAMVRSGDADEKEILFQSMLNFRAQSLIPSTKRGHKLNELETVVTQAVRTVANVKNRQTRVEDAALEMLEQLVERRDLLKNKALIFLLEPGQIDRNVAGLIANKLMAKYQRPVCILTKVTDENGVSYQGSARGCDLAGVSNFKDICEESGLTLYQSGHQGAFGLGIPVENLDEFISYLNTALSWMTSEPVYYVDYMYHNTDVIPENILDIARYEDIWGKDMDEPYIAIKNLRVKKSMVTVYDKKDLTLKITLPNQVSIMLFKAPEELCDKLQNQNPGYYTLNIVGRCNGNEWGGRITPQIIVKDYEITGQTKFDF